MKPNQEVGPFEIFQANKKVYITKKTNFHKTTEHGLDRNQVKELITILGKMLDDQVYEVFPGLKNLS